MAVLNTACLVVGQNVIVGSGSSSFGGPSPNCSVVTIFSGVSVALKFLNYIGDVAVGQTISSGATVTPAGIAGPNDITVATATNLTGYLKGNGAVVYTGTDPIPVANGGTGSATAAAALTALGAAASGANADITSLASLSTPLSIAQGGTSGNSVANALNALTIQSGQCTLSSGVFTVSTKTITANSIVVTALDSPSGTRTSFAGYKITALTPGVPGSFVITAISDAAATLSSCADVVNYIIIG